MSSSMSDVVGARLQTAARKLGTVDPLQYVGPLLQRTFTYPTGSQEYSANALTPGAAPCEPSFSEREPEMLRFTILPLTPDHSPGARRNEATREMRRLIAPIFGNGAVDWFDKRSEAWRGTGTEGRLHYGAFFGSAYHSNGLHASKIYYEMSPGHMEDLPPRLHSLVQMAREAMPNLRPVFTTISCGKEYGSQRVTMAHQGPLRLGDLGPLLTQLGLGHQLAGIMQVIGISLGGLFDFPDQSVLVGITDTAEGPEVKVEVLLGMVPHLPQAFLDLLTLGLAERPRELHALGRWLRAFTPESADWPGRFSVLSIRVTPRSSARVSLYLRPAEFEVYQRLSDVSRLQPVSH